ncbi:MAG: glutamate synthase large subunit [Firmicutes bacterium]|nr:glutamate synthase large subunit [Bacillota bacterium]
MDNSKENTLYREDFEHDACGIGTIISIDGVPSYSIVDGALKIVERLEHRAGKDATGETGDGVGILLQVSHKFFSKVGSSLGVNLGGERDFGVGMFFFPQNTLTRHRAMKMFEVICEKEGVEFLAWREVPTDSSILGQRAKDSMPHIMQGFVRRPDGIARGLDFDRKLYVIRRVFEKSNEMTYVASLSSRTIVYKGMFLVHQLRRFYLDLQDTDYESAISMVHSRFSTNTTPSWERAHPNRMILHNGEINTIRGNCDRMLAREETMSSKCMGDDMHKVYPVITPTGSDSAMLDNTLEYLVMNGIPLPLAVMMLIPEPWKTDQSMSRSRRDMYHYYATMMEPWDGPASIIFSDGDVMGAVLDRNGLRPSRYYITKDRQLILASEAGVLDIDPENILVKSRLRPGRLLLVDTVRKAVISDEECKEYFASRKPYGEWLDSHLVTLSSLPVPNGNVPSYTKEERSRLYKAFGYTEEDIADAILPMAKTGGEPTASMGVDTPLAVLSSKHQPLFNYFKQLFAQVTNPPIDSLREEIVTDTTVYLGKDGNILEDKPDNCTVLQINNPILTSVDLMKIRSMKKPGFSVKTVSLLYYSNSSLEKEIDRLFVDVDRAYRDGANIIILSDRGIDENHVAIPSLLAVSAIEHYLVRTKKRTALAIILESGEPRDVHHFATLLGYGASAINPYLAQECVEELVADGRLCKDITTAINDYNFAILKGIVKIAAKMGISTIQSYQAAQIFEAVGISRSVIDKYFTNTVSPVDGIGIDEIAEDVQWRHSHAFDPLGLGVDTTPDSVGNHKLRSSGAAEDHLYNPETIIALREATHYGSYKRFKEYSAMVDDETRPHTLRGLLDFRFDEGEAIPIEEVEPASEIVKRFKTGAMSYGSISEEAHKCMAIAMNTIGGKSNSGEGGEDPSRFGTKMNSAIKQVASGRFGVTSEYLCSADEIQIKMAQGAKPGEGGHLPGKKVYPWVANTRYSTPGVALISPPPHHDIYSIEDLAQLIYDLKNSNRDARISVKLVSEAGVGTIAAGVAKAGAQVVLISGFDGGTGAAPKSSIHNAGLPWELGVAETHQTLVRNGLRSRVRIETDGKLMTGRDVAIACMLGAEEFGFATAPLISMGCVMMRVCNQDTCPAGIATQNPTLRARFCGKPEYVVNFMTYVAEEVREIMAKLGVRTMDELVGRTDKLCMLDSEKVSESAPRASDLDFSSVLAKMPHEHFEADKVFDFELQKTLDESVLLPEFEPYFKKHRPHETSVNVSSVNRTAGTILGSVITKKFGKTLPDDTYVIHAKGGGGQSFGAFIPKGLTIELTGDSNDYFGKGLSGGKLIVKPDEKLTFEAKDNIIIGNVALYGATSGEAYISGIAGERFCVRNSGAYAVVEGCGDHGCEYMTGGRAVILGPTGKNFAAGMSGGIAYVLDLNHDLYLRLNKQMVSMTNVTERHDYIELRTMIENHVAATGSKFGKKILESFDDYIGSFKKIVPTDYQKMLTAIAQLEEKGIPHEQARLDAFYSVLG